MRKLILIFGLGGSGTRLYIDILKNYDIPISKNLNESLDDLDTFSNTGYYISIKHKMGFKSYEEFKAIFKNQLKKNGFFENNIFCLKEPNFHIILHLVIRFCRDENINLIPILIIRDYKYMINSLNQNQFKRWRHLFKYKFDSKYLKTKFERTEYWYYANKRAIKIITESKLKYIILSFDNIVKNPTNEISKLIKFLDIVENKKINNKFIDIIKSHKNKNRSKKENYENIPENLKLKYKKILKFIN